MAARREGRAPQRGQSDTGARILAAIPAIGFALFIVLSGGLVFAAGLVLLGVVALSELYRLMERVRPVNLGGILALTGMVLAAHWGQPKHVLMVLVGAFPVIFYLSFLRPRRPNVSWAIAATLFGVLWIGLPLVHAVFLRALPHGDGLLIDVLVGTFLGDTAAYFGGRMYGRRPLAPSISPNKTLEGLVAGIFGATFAFWCAGLYQDWLSGADALLIGFLVALAAPVGDLFESLIKRDLDVKDTGHIFGAHGGVLDRLDAVFFTVVVGYYAAVALGYT
ncbi:MAG TPA: phosphatidate cytidylyltransferase [Thermoleophilaceae bacterium]|jgi:phosphatidate cytidylyltransferase